MRDWSKYSNVDMKFFNHWTPELIYVIGLFIADGSLSNYDKYKMYYVSIKDLEFLTNNYFYLKQREISNVLGRSVKFVNMKAFKLGLRKR